MRKMWIVALAAALAIGTIQTGWAQPAAKYPTKAITVIHGFKPGGGSDQLAQLTGPFLEKVVKQQWVNVYKPGADGAIAWKEVGKNTKPDGYTLTTVLTPKTQLNALVLDNAGYAMSDFEPIANMVFDPGILVVAVNSKFKTVKDLVDAAKKDPGAVTMAHSGNGGDDWFNGVMIERLTGVQVQPRPVRGRRPGHPGGRRRARRLLHLEHQPRDPAAQGGQAAGAGGLHRPTPAGGARGPHPEGARHQPGRGSYRGYLAPKGTPREIVDTLADAMEKVASDPEYRKLCESNNLLVDFKKGDVNRKWLQEQNEKLTKIAQDMGLAKKQ